MTRQIVRAIGKYKDKGIHLGDVATDIVIDSKQHIWLLELQLYHAVYGRNTVRPPEFYTRILTNPFNYAKALAGFSGERQ